MKRRFRFALSFGLLALLAPATAFGNPPIMPSVRAQPPLSHGHGPRYGNPYGYGYGSGISIGIGYGSGGYYGGPGFGSGYGYGGYGSPFYGRGYGPGFGFGPPPVYNGFYSNGLSLYGPPVPTGHSIPGVFGGADGTWGTPPFLLGGVGAYVPLNGPPDPVYTRGRLYDPLALPSTTTRVMTTRPADEEAVARGPDRRSILIEIAVPSEDSAVYIEGVVTQQKGLLRKFSSPALTTGEIYSYEIRVETPVGGRLVTHEKKASAYPGQTIEMTFR